MTVEVVTGVTMVALAKVNLLNSASKSRGREGTWTMAGDFFWKMEVKPWARLLRLALTVNMIDVDVLELGSVGGKGRAEW